MKTDFKEKLLEFIAERPSLNLTAFCNEAGISKSLIDKIIATNTRVTPKTQKKLLPILKKYGWTGPTGITKRKEKAG